MMLSNSNKVAFAIFVKTAELSRVKTRLGCSIGMREAKTFYDLSVNKIRHEMGELKMSRDGDQIDVYWSLAEHFTPLHALKWCDFNRIHQKGKCLGERISSVYNSLIEKGYKKVVLLGGDSPQLTHLDYKLWAERSLDSKEVLIGPADDGGFYTLMGCDPIPTDLWRSVEYSAGSTVSDLTTQLKANGYSVDYLPTTYDIDYIEDLDKLQKSIIDQSSLASQNLKQFIKGLNI